MVEHNSYFVDFSGRKLTMCDNRAKKGVWFYFFLVTCLPTIGIYILHSYNASLDRPTYVHFSLIFVSHLHGE